MQELNLFRGAATLCRISYVCAASLASVHGLSRHTSPSVGAPCCHVWLSLGCDDDGGVVVVEPVLSQAHEGGVLLNQQDEERVRLDVGHLGGGGETRGRGGARGEGGVCMDSTGVTCNMPNG